MSILACIDSESSTSTWLSRLESSGWLRQLQLIINAGNVVAANIQKGWFILIIQALLRVRVALYIQKGLQGGGRTETHQV